MDSRSDESLAIEEAKKRLRSISESVDPLSVIKEHPIKAVGMAFLAGVALNAAQKGKPLTPSLFELGTQVLKRLSSLFDRTSLGLALQNSCLTL